MKPRTILLAFLCALCAAAPAHGGAILREVWTGTNGSSIANIPTNQPPNSTNWVTDYFEAPVNMDDNYGQRMRGVIRPPMSGNYTFWINSDDQSMLYLSTNHTPAGKVGIASNIFANLRTWNEPSQQSAPIWLDTGKVYYIEALMKEGTGWDYLCVKWKRPDGVEEEPLPATYLFLEGRPVITAGPTNLTVAEGGTAVFQVAVTDLYATSFQWQRGGSSMAGARASSFVLADVALTNDGAQFRCLATNQFGAVTSTVATLSVTADTNRPFVSGAINVGLSTIRLTFSEPVEAASGTNTANYTLSGGVSVLGAAFGSDTRTIVLTNSALVVGNAYTVTVNNVRDRAAVPNTIWTNSQWVLTAVEFVSQDIGSPAVAGVAVQAGTGLDVVACGSGIAGGADQFHFDYVQRTGDFDVNVRVASMGAAELWAKAGIMARESLSATSLYAAVLATPSLSGVSFYYQYSQGGNLLTNGDIELGKEPGYQWPRYWGAWGSSVAETNRTAHAGSQSAPAAAHDGVWMVSTPNEWWNSGNNWRGEGQWFAVTPGERYAFSAFYLIQSNLPPSQCTYADIEWYDAAKAWPDIAPRYYTAFFTNQCGWTYVAVTGTAPLGAVWGKAVVAYEDTDGRTNSPAELYNAYWDSAEVLNLGFGSAGFFPVSYPSTWLRLRRQGNIFTGYASCDGSRWALLGSVSNAMSSTIYLGLAAASLSPTDTVAVSFRDWGNVAGGTTGSYWSASVEPPGPSSRRTGLVLSEIMYHPPERPDGKDLEFVEVFNAEPVDVDLGGYRVSGDVEYTFPAGTLLPAGQFIVVARDAAAVRSVYGVSRVVGDFSGSLPNDEGTVRLRNPRDAILQDVTYTDEPRWPAAADGAGHSLVLVRPSWGEGLPEAWAASAAYGGSPGAWEPLTGGAYGGVVINEYLAHTDFSTGDFVEVYNAATASVSLAGCSLSDEADTNKFLITNLTLSAYGFAYFMTNQLGFNFEKEGGTIYLRAPDQHVIDAVRFEGQQNGVASGRFPDGSPGFHELTSPTPGTNNRPLGIRNVVINEIMYHPISESDADEYVELYNRGAASTNVAGWRLAGGITYTLPTNAVIPAGGYVVVAKDAAHLMATYAALKASNTFGNYSGKLADGGERIALIMPHEEDTLIVADEVTYGDDEQWGSWADGDGSSLELKDPRADHRLASSWGASDETNKAPWTTICVTGRLDNGMGPVDEVHILMLGAGECLVDDVDVHAVGGGNRVNNGTFNANATGWTIEGTHFRSSWETNGGGSGGCLHVRASAQGDTGVNRIESTLTSALATNIDAVIQARVRWLAGHPDLVIRVHGNYLEAVAHMSVPTNGGTPGAANTRYVTNAPPAIWDVSHNPVLPAANEQVLVAARTHDPDGIVSNVLRYRVDPSASVTSVRMTDDGTGGDQVRGDGLYSAWIPGQAAGTLVGFYVESWGSNLPPASSSSRYPSGAPAREGLVRFGEEQSPGNLGTYRLWMTQTNLDTWSTRLELDNEPLDTTLAYGNFRAVYNVGVHYRGSPFIRATYGTATSTVNALWIEPPKSTPLLGADEFNLDTLELGRDNTRIRERLCFWMADRLGLPFSHQRYVVVSINGLRRGDVYSDSQHEGGDYLDSWFEDDGNGELFKVDDWFEFTNMDYIAEHNLSTEAMLTNYVTTGGAKKQAKYRYNFEKKANHGLNDNFTNLFDLVDAANETNAAAYKVRMNAQADVEEWLKAFAVRHIVGDWDGYGFLRGKNMYAYKPAGGRWKMLLWDLDFCLGGGSTGYDDDRLLSTYDPGWGIYKEPVLQRMYDYPPFRHAMLGIYWDAVNSFLKGSEIEPVIDAWHEALERNGVLAEDTAALKQWISRRRPYLLFRAAGDYGYYAAFQITSNGGTNFDSSANLVTLQGKAPVGVKTIRINGVDADVTWTTITNWQAQVVLSNGSNTLSVAGYDADGNPVSGAADTIAVRFLGTNDLPAGNIVINEIMYHPPDSSPGTEFVELRNLSTNKAFDLHDYALDGAGLTFGQSTVLAPTSYLVVAENPTAFALKYGGIPVAAQYSGSLDNAGELLRLVQLNGTNADVVVDEVIYDDVPPWPTNADGGGVSLQLLDAVEDNNRVANWAVSTNGTPYTPGASNSVYRDLPPFPSLWLNELQATNTGSIRDNRTNAEPWIEIFSAEAGSLVLTNYYLTDTYTNLAAWAFPAGCTAAPAGFLLVWADAQTNETSTTNYHAGFRLSASGGSLALVRSNASQRIIIDYVNYPAIPTDRSYGDYPDGVWTNRQLFNYVTPRATNNASRPVLMFINEWMADNAQTISNESGNAADWFELYNAGTGTVDLASYFLTDNLNNPTKTTVTVNGVLSPGQFLVVWADNTNQVAGSTNLHVNFALSKGGEVIGLYAPDGVPVDSIAFGTQQTDITEGRWPDAEPAIYTLAIPTPGGPNIVSTNNAPPVLSAVGNRTTDEEILLAFSVSATDTDTPAQRLTFSLDPGAPSGAGIDPASGLFTWTPSETNGPGTNSATIRVTDNGWTNKSDSETIAITVFEVNLAPAVGAVNNIVLSPGSLLIITIPASDADVPANALAFSLDPGYPSGAGIGSGDGVFRWQPADAQAPSTNVIVVRVTDNGSPVLSGTNVFIIEVTDTNVLFTAGGSATEDANGFRVIWGSTSGETYRVQYLEDMRADFWIALPGDVYAITVVTSKTDTASGAATQRFYRVLRLLP